MQAYIYTYKLINIDVNVIHIHDAYVHHVYTVSHCAGMLIE